MRDLQEMSREELVTELRARRSVRSCEGAGTPREPDAVLEELRVHQVELVMQNDELRETQRELEDSRAQYQDLFDGAPVGYVTLEPSGTILAINATGAALLAETRANLVGHSIYASLRGEAGQKLRAHLADAANSVRCLATEIQITERGLSLEFVTTAHEDENGIRTLRMVFSDVSEARTARAMLQWLNVSSARLAACSEERDLLDTLIHQCMPFLGDYAAVYFVPVGGGEPVRIVERFAMGDPGASDAKRMKLVAITGLRDAVRNVVAAGRGQLLSQPPAHGPVAWRRDAERAVTRTAIIAPLLVRKEMLGAVVVIRDSRRPPFNADDLEALEDLDRRAAMSLAHARLLRDARTVASVAEADRRRAEEANRGKDEFLAMVSHELRTPLTAVLGWTRMLRANMLGTERQGRALETIERNALAQVRLIEDLLDTGRIITGEVSLAFEPVNVVREVAAVVEATRPSAETKRIELALSVGDDSLSVDGDAMRLQQIVSNVLGNAVKFTPEGGRVLVSVGREGAEVVIRVKDSGIGIDPGFVPQLFERFRQADTGPSRSYGGLGLGLAIAKHLANRHGGVIEASSAGLGHGATFCVRLPLSARERASLPPSDAAALDPSALAGVRVMLVEDDPDARELMTSILETAGAVVVGADSAAEAIRGYAAGRVDVIVSDIGLPGEDGCEMLARLRGMTATCAPALAVSAYASPTDAQRTRDAGFDRFLSKPIDPADLVAVVSGLAAGHGNRASPRATG